jgi:hypothetical protein
MGALALLAQAHEREVPLGAVISALASFGLEEAEASDAVRSLTVGTVAGGQLAEISGRAGDRRDAELGDPGAVVRLLPAGRLFLEAILPTVQYLFMSRARAQAAGSGWTDTTLEDSRSTPSDRLRGAIDLLRRVVLPAILIEQPYLDPSSTATAEDQQRVLAFERAFGSHGGIDLVARLADGVQNFALHAGLEVGELHFLQEQISRSMDRRDLLRWLAFGDSGGEP